MNLLRLIATLLIALVLQARYEATLTVHVLQICILFFFVSDQILEVGMGTRRRGVSRSKSDRKSTLTYCKIEVAELITCTPVPRGSRTGELGKRWRFSEWKLL